MNNKSKRDTSKHMSRQRNEGEGNRTAARLHNEAQRRFVRGGKLDEQAQGAENSLDSAERHELEHAGLVGKRHAAEEDPAIKKR